MTNTTNFQSLVELQVKADMISAELVSICCDAALIQSAWLKEQQQLRQKNQYLIRALIQAKALNVQIEAHLQQARLENQCDALTHTPNRNIMQDRIQQAISSRKRQNKHFAVLFIDLDNFKPVNDRYGHAAGDQVLQQVAERLTKTIRDSDTLSRYGGDEFLVLLPEVAHREDVLAIAEKMGKVLAEVYALDGHQIRLSASIGVAVFPEDGTDVSSLVQQADSAMYSAKRQGGGVVCG